jgi:hypothetical protein
MVGETGVNTGTERTLDNQVARPNGRRGAHGLA